MIQYLYMKNGKIMSLKDKKILVTGGAGFIGSHITDALLKLDNEVTVIDDLSNGNLSNLSFAAKNRNFNFINGDIRDFKLFKNILNNIDIIFHEAALVNVQKSITHPFKTNDVNVNGTLNLLSMAKNYSIQKIIYASSASVYGDLPPQKKTEEMILNPLSPYAVSKLTCEYYLSVFFKIYGLKTTSLRYFNVYGPRQTDNQYSGVIPIFISRIINGLPLIIFGDGLQTRDFIYIEDLVNANLLAAEKESAVGQIFNVGSGTCISIIDLAKEVIKLANYKNEYEFANSRSGDIRHSSADISKIRKLLGYEPKFTLKKGLNKFYEWYKREKAGSK